MEALCTDASGCSLRGRHNNDPPLKAAYSELPLYMQGQPRCEGSGDSWAWNGNIEKPTLSPSILAGKSESGHGWHGYLQDGIWKGC